MNSTEKEIVKQVLTQLGFMKNQLEAETHKKALLKAVELLLLLK